MKNGYDLGVGTKWVMYMHRPGGFSLTFAPCAKATANWQVYLYEGFLSLYGATD
jgi:hypothetical protein